jgi:hypothetical protein
MRQVLPSLARLTGSAADATGAVVAVRAQRLPEPGIVVAVLLRTGQVSGG